MKKLAIVYWSATGNTEKMAETIGHAFKEENDDLDLIYSSDFSRDMVDNYDILAFGCPAMGDEDLEAGSFEPMFSSIEDKLKDKKIALFGSYEWADGEWMDIWEKRCRDLKAQILASPLKSFDYPNDQVLSECKQLGRMLAQS